MSITLQEHIDDVSQKLNQTFPDPERMLTAKFGCLFYSCKADVKFARNCNIIIRIQLGLLSKLIHALTLRLLLVCFYFFKFIFFDIFIDGSENITQYEFCAKLELK